MDSSIIGAIISGIAAIIAAIIGRSKGKYIPLYVALFFFSIFILVFAYNKDPKEPTVEPEDVTPSISIPAETSDVGPWSEWTKAPASKTSTREVETREIITGYVMTVYVTQENAYPYSRVFRDFSIGNNFDAYDARESYAEKHFEIQVTPEQFDSAAAYEPGDLIYNKGLYVGGYNKSSKTAYVMPIALDSKGRYYPLFIKEELKETEYRYRDKK